MAQSTKKPSKKRSHSASTAVPVTAEGFSSADSEDEEVLIKTGKVPRRWYDDFKHLGYDIEAKSVMKKAQESKIDELIRRSEDPKWWRTVRDELNNEDIVLSDQQLDLLRRVRSSRFADAQIAQNEVNPFL